MFDGLAGCEEVFVATQHVGHVGSCIRLIVNVTNSRTAHSVRDHDSGTGEDELVHEIAAFCRNIEEWPRLATTKSIYQVLERHFWCSETRERCLVHCGCKEVS